MCFLQIRKHASSFYPVLRFWLFRFTSEVLQWRGGEDCQMRREPWLQDLLHQIQRKWADWSDSSNKSRRRLFSSDHAFPHHSVCAFSLFTFHCVCAFSPEGGITGRGCSTKDKVRRPFPLLCCLLLIISFPPAQYTTHLGDADSVLCRKQQPQLLLWQVYYKECETNSYGEGTEKFCYCNFYLCNRAPASSSFYALCLPSLWWLFTTLYTFSATKNQFGEAE